MIEHRPKIAEEFTMHGRTAIVRSSVRSADAAGSGELRRRVAVAVARRFGGSARTSTDASIPMAVPVEAPASEAEGEMPALDARVRETGEW